MSNIGNIFSDCFLADTVYPDHEQHKDQLVTFIKEYDKQNKIKDKDFVSPHIKYNLAESAPNLKFFEEANNDVLNNLKKHFETIIVELYRVLCSRTGTKTLTKNTNYQDEKCEVTESWYHITKTGGYHDLHNHAHSSFSAIYFLDVSECDYKNGSMRFYKPFNTIVPVGDIGLNWIQNDLIDFIPKDGQIIVFPGFLDHAAIPYYGKSDRYIIAVNARIIPC